MDCRFEEVITTRERLREIVELPSHRVAGKAIDHIDDICRRFIAASPFVMIATRGADGLLDLRPR
jgi:predicted pyridoxine 5'-phosphate oxidase superfamily flavin-nucleotide-binding protein